LERRRGRLCPDIIQQHGPVGGCGLDCCYFRMPSREHGQVVPDARVIMVLEVFGNDGFEKGKFAVYELGRLLEEQGALARDRDGNADCEEQQECGGEPDERPYVLETDRIQKSAPYSASFLRRVLGWMPRRPAVFSRSRPV